MEDRFNGLLGKLFSLAVVLEAENGGNVAHTGPVGDRNFGQSRILGMQVVQFWFREVCHLRVLLATSSEPSMTKFQETSWFGDS